MDKTTLYLPADLRLQLEQAAKRERRSQAEIVREALGRYLSAAPAAKFRSVGLGADDEVTGASSEAWLRQSWGQKRRGNP